MTTTYIALKTDIIHSRKLSDRGQVQEQFLRVAEQVNAHFVPSFESAFIITHGDEAQGLIKSACADSTFEIIEFLIETMAPIELRFGLGYGTLNTKVQLVAIGMDGEVWQNAKEAIENAPKSHQRVSFRGFDLKIQSIIESLTNLLLFLHDHWTEEQTEVIKLVRTGQSQTLIAKSLDVSEAAISKRLSAAGWREYTSGKEALKNLLSHNINP